MPQVTLAAARTVLAAGGAGLLYAGWHGYAEFLRSADGLCAGDASWDGDCVRLGSAWPGVSLALACGVVGGLLLVPCGGGGTGRMPLLPPPSLVYKDNRARMGVVAAIVAALGTAWTAFFATHSARLGEPQRMHWQAQAVLWGAMALGLVRDAVRGSEAAFHWTLRVAVCAQLVLCALAEPYFAIFAARHAAEPVLGSPHMVAALGTALASVAAALVVGCTHRRGFLEPAATSRARGAEPAPAHVREYATPLTRVRAVHEPQVESPEHAASPLGALLFDWVTPLLRRGTHVTIDSGDLYALAAADRPLRVWRRFARVGRAGGVGGEGRAPRRPLVRALGATFAVALGAQALLALGSVALAYGAPFFLQRILRSIRQHGAGHVTLQATSRAVYADAFGLLVSSLAHSLLVNRVLWMGRKVSVRVQGLLVAELSSRALRRRCKTEAPKAADDSADDEDASSAASADGRIANMLTSDLESVGHVASYLNEIYTLPIKFVLGAWYLYTLVGVSALIGLTITVVYYPLSKLMVKYLIKYQKRLMAIEDERITMISEMFTGIRAVKLFGWQSRFIEKVKAKRFQELALYWKLMLLQLPVSFVQSITTSLMLVTILAVYSLIFGHALTADVVFPTITVFSMVSSTFNSAPGLFRWMSSCYVSLKRIESFMVLAPIQDLDDRLAPQPPAAEPCSAIGFANACFEWSPASASDGGEDGEAASSSSLSATPAADASLSRKNSVATTAPPASERTPLLCDASSEQSALASVSVPASDQSPPMMMTRFTLQDISLSFPLGGLSVIVGPTGSGKSSLLAALIGEMTLTSGHVMLPTADALTLDAELAAGRYAEIIRLSGQGRVMRDIAYVAQEAWLRNATIRDNILFGEPYDQQRYEEVLRVCALKPDLRILDAADRTEIGERGVTLSGGQKQRVALARAVYSSRRILLIDDCLSAVDAHTGKHILTECLLGQTPLMQGRTRVLVTHHVSACMPHADYMVVLQDGRVAASGSPEFVQQQGGGLSREILELELTVTDDKQQPELVPVDSSDSSSKANIAAAASANVNDLRPEDDYTTERLAALYEQRGIVDPTAADLDELEGALVEDEEREQGYVRPEIWLDYLRMCGSWWYWALVLASLLVNQSASILQDYMVRLWMSSADSDNDSTSHTVVFWLSIYLLSGLLSTAISLAAWINECWGSLHAGRLFHERLFSRVISATPRFFDKTPIGRVISRFSRDMRTIDGDILGQVTSLVSQLIHMVSVFVIISVVTPPFVIIALLMTLAYTRLGIYYLNATRELKRLDSISMSPLLSLFSELITGVESIRAFGAQNQYTMEAMNRVDVHNRPYYLLWAANRWLCSRIELLGCLVSFSTTILILFNLDTIDAGLAGFVLMYAISFSEYMLWFIRNYCDCEISMNSVERVNQYMNLEQEAALHSTPENKPPADWPATGSVQVDDLVLEYVPGTPVIRGISFAAAHGEKIGVVGRTGAGKSTLSLAFLRFIEAAKGRVLLDSVDISKIGLEELRRNVTIIPQDPTLFNGTIRFNLDPFSEFPDELLWDALKRSHLVHDETSGANSSSSSGTASPTESLPTADGSACAVDRMSGIFKSLDAEIKENGRNLSLGQRQLVALARALVRRSRLIIMDEATASVDFATDDRIQRTIRGSEFANSTLFCIAHRLRTIIDYDRVLVLDKGEVAEFDTPWNLLQNEAGIFRGMCEKSGEYEHLYTLAQSKHGNSAGAALISF